MTNLYLDPVYTTFTDVRDSTNIAALIALTDAEIDELITRAQDAIDAYLQCIEGMVFVDPQNWLYPIEDPDDNSVALIPLDIQKATIQVVENIFLLWTPTSAQVVWGQITSEKQGPRAVTYWEQSNSFDGNLIPNNTQMLLDKYKIYTFRQLNGYNVSVHWQGHNHFSGNL